MSLCPCSHGPRTRHPVRVRACFIAVLALVSVGCAAKPQRICTGEESITFALQQRSGDSSVPVNFALENGSFFLYVTGKCEYWVNYQSRTSAHGFLDAAQEQRLHDVVDYDNLALTGGSWQTPGCSDAEPFYMLAQGSQSVCVCDCTGPGTPSAVRATNDAFFGSWHDQDVGIFDELVLNGEPVAGPARVLLYEDSSNEAPRPFLWPAAFDFDAFVTDLSAPESGSRPPGVLLPEELTQALREFERAADGFPVGLGDPLPVDHNGERYEAVLRDELPFPLPFH